MNYSMMYSRLTQKNKSVVTNLICELLRQQKETGECGNDDRLFTIYAIRCAKNGKIYVGRTVDVVQRMKQHFGALRSGNKLESVNCVTQKSAFQRDFDRYGEDAFETYILEDNIRVEDADAREWHWIDEYNSADSRFGYNKISGPRHKRLFGYPDVIPGLPPKKKLTEEEWGDQNDE